MRVCDVDLIGSSLVVQRSHDPDNRKGGRADVLPIPASLYPSELVQFDISARKRSTLPKHAPLYPVRHLKWSIPLLLIEAPATHPIQTPR